MTWSLGLTSSGDLALGSNGLAQVANEKKLVQDLRCELLEEKNTNQFYPNYGSTLDSNVIGETIYDESDLELRIESELSDLINRYKQRQLVKAKSDMMIFGKAYLTKREALVDFRMKNFKFFEGAADIEVELVTYSANPSFFPTTITLSI